MALEIHSLMKNPDNVWAVLRQFEEYDVRAGSHFPIASSHITDVDRRRGTKNLGLHNRP
jgi:hypothetical protein